MTHEHWPDSLAYIYEHDARQLTRNLRSLAAKGKELDSQAHIVRRHVEDMLHFQRFTRDAHIALRTGIDCLKADVLAALELTDRLEALRLGLEAMEGQRGEE